MESARPMTQPFLRRAAICIFIVPMMALWTLLACALAWPLMGALGWILGDRKPLSGAWSQIIDVPSSIVGEMWRSTR